MRIKWIGKQRPGLDHGSTYEVIKKSGEDIVIVDEWGRYVFLAPRYEHVLFEYA